MLFYNKLINIYSKLYSCKKIFVNLLYMKILFIEHIQLLVIFKVMNNEV
jgi:hypothetical protein